MGRRLQSVLVFGALVGLQMGLESVPAHAAEPTDVVDAFDYENDNPFDFHIEPTFRQRFERGRVTRESSCTAALTPDRCEEDSVVFNRELDYTRVVNTMEFDLQFGLYQDFEFHFHLPIVLGDQRKLEFADGVNGTNSTIAPNDQRVQQDLDPNVSDSFGDFFATYQFFDVPNDGPRRSGLGDIGIGLAWSPFNDERNPHAANLMLGFDYIAPSGTPARGTNKGVGRGVHEVQFHVAGSRVLETYLEPYFVFDFAVPVAASNGLFQANVNSPTTAPGPRFDTTFGTEVLMYPEDERGQYYSFDLGLTFGYTFEGRDYSPIFDALNSSPCNGLTPEQAGYGAAGPDGNAYQPDPDVVAPEDAACAWVVQQPGNAQTSGSITSTTPYAHDGIVDVQGHARIGGHTGFNLQFNEYVKLRLGTQLQWTAPHFLTTADAGRDADNDDTVDLNPSGNGEDIERNPYYNLATDTVGRRFRFENVFSVGWNATLAFQF